MTAYNYTVSTDTANSIVDEERLLEEVRDSEDITKAISNISVNGDSLVINTKEDLGAQSSFLDSIVASHTGEPLVFESITKFTEEMPIGGKRVADRGFSFTAIKGVTTEYDFQVTEDIFVKDGFLLAKGYEFDDEITMSIVHTISNTVIHDYIKNSPLYATRDTNVGIAEATNKAITETNFNGLKVRIAYKSTGLEDVKVKVLMRAYM